MPAFVREAGLDVDPLADRAVDQLEHVLDQLGRRHRFRQQRLGAGEGEQAAGEGGGAGRALHRIVEVEFDLAARAVQLAPGEVEPADDDRQHVVEIVGDAAGQLADRLHLLDLAQLGLGRGALGRLRLEPLVGVAKLARAFLHRLIELHARASTRRRPRAAPARPRERRGRRGRRARPRRRRSGWRASRAIRYRCRRGRRSPASRASAASRLVRSAVAISSSLARSAGKRRRRGGLVEIGRGRRCPCGARRPRAAGASSPLRRSNRVRSSATRRDLFRILPQLALQLADLPARRCAIRCNRRCRCCGPRRAHSGRARLRTGRSWRRWSGSAASRS